MPNFTAMKISIDTKEDSHDEIKKVIKMLQNLVGDSQEIFSNQPSATQEAASPFANIFGDASASPSSAVQDSDSSSAQDLSATKSSEESSQSAEDLFAELFSEDELKKMDNIKEEKEDEQETEEEVKPKDKKYDIELY